MWGFVSVGACPVGVLFWGVSALSQSQLKRVLRGACPPPPPPSHTILSQLQHALVQTQKSVCPVRSCAFFLPFSCVHERFVSPVASARRRLTRMRSQPAVTLFGENKWVFDVTLFVGNCYKQRPGKGVPSERASESWRGFPLEPAPRWSPLGYDCCRGQLLRARREWVYAALHPPRGTPMERRPRALSRSSWKSLCGRERRGECWLRRPG